MLHIVITRTLLALLSIVLSVLPLRAQDMQDGQVWVQVVALGQISENWRTHLEIQPRVFEDASELGLTIVRVALGRQLTPRVSLWGGYAWVPRTLGPDTHHEQRVWQQLSITFPNAGRWMPTARIRQEQRWLDQWGDVVHRVRLMGRVQRPLRESRWHVATYDEAMFTLDTTTPGPYSGYDRNRLFGGVGYRFSPVFTTELGYLWENSTIRGPLQRNDHVALAMLNLSWPTR